jgi:hypothetical protein
MLRFNQSTNQIRIDTNIKYIDKDGTEVTAPVMILIGVNKVPKKYQYSIYKIANSLFNKQFVSDRRKLMSKPPWWKIW